MKKALKDIANTIIFVSIALLFSCCNEPSALERAAKEKVKQDSIVNYDNKVATQKVANSVKANAEGTNLVEIRIGSQTWTTTNLAVSVFRNGDTIPEAKSDEEWKKAGSLQKAAWCYYNNDSKHDSYYYGKLYNWYAVMDRRGLAPNGFHIPNADEFNTLLEYFGLDPWSTLAAKADVCMELYASGFGTLPGGVRYLTGGFGMQESRHWWTSSHIRGNIDSPQDFYIKQYYTSYCNTGFEGGCGMSVRCIKGEAIEKMEEIPVKESEQIEYDEYGKLKEGLWNVYDEPYYGCKGNYIDGFKEGEWLCKQVNGECTRKINYKNGLLEGEWISYTVKGNLDEKGNYLNGKKEGEWFHYYTDYEGQDKIEWIAGIDHYKNGLLVDTKKINRSKYVIGQMLIGGFIFKLDETGEHGLIVYQSDLKEYNSSVTGGNWEKAKYLCERHDNWRLPSIDELQLIYDAKVVMSKLQIRFNADLNYWSSTEVQYNNSSEEGQHWLKTMGMIHGNIQLNEASSEGLYTLAVKEF